MPKFTAVMDHVFAASPETIFHYFADHSQFMALLGAKGTRIKDGNDGHVNGLGSVRKITLPPPAFEETILTFKPNSLLEYTITKRGLVKNHWGRIEFHPTAEGGTRLHYTIVFDQKIPCTGGLIVKMLKGSFDKNVAKLKL